MPSGSAVSDGSPPPTRTTESGVGPATTLVASRSVGFRLSSVAAAVSSFVTDPGTMPSVEPRSHSGGVPRGAEESSTTPERSPSSGADAGPESTLDRPPWVGTGAVGASGLSAGIGTGG